MPTLTIYRGLPASGKSTVAKLAVDKSKGKTKRVERDQIREMLDFGRWSHRNEEVVIKTLTTLIRQYLTDGYNVISSDTNLNPIVVQMLKKLGKECDANVVIDESFLDVPVEECIKRDLNRLKSVGESVIWRMYYEYVAPPPVYNADPLLQKTVIVDLDGTLASISHRNPFDASDAENDPIREHVRFAVELYRNAGIHIVIFSGRNDKYRTQTEAFLTKHNVTYNALYMRPDGDFRRDSVLKNEWVDNHIEGKYNVVAVFDDRKQVCTEVWKHRGYPLFDVGLGYDF